MFNLDPQTARKRLLRHSGGEPLSEQDLDLLIRFERAKRDPAFSDIERARLKRDLAVHPVLGGPSIPGIPDLRMA
jgi:hypothetical protein